MLTPHTIRGPGLFISQFIGDQSPFDSLRGIGEFAARLGFQALQVPVHDPRIIDLERSDESGYIEGLARDVESSHLVISEISAHRAGQLMAVHPTFDDVMDALAPAEVRSVKEAGTMHDCSLFGHHDGQKVYEAALRSSAGATAKIITYGAVVRDLIVPVGNGSQRVVNGLRTLEDYARYSPHFGAIAGRYANRIGGGHFILDGESYHLPLNQAGKHSLHGGGAGLGKQVWQIVERGGNWVQLTHVSPDGFAGYPGTLTVTCTYRLLGTSLRIELSARTDKTTPVNLCHHSYFNLDGSDTILDHTLELAADFYTPLGSDQIPTGEVRTIAGTPYDFRAPRPVRAEASDGQGRFRYDVNFVLRKDRLAPSGIEHLPLAYAGTFASARNGLALEVWTTEPGMQVYDGFKIDVPVAGHDGVSYRASSGLCLEPQHFPDSPNQPHFPSTILRPDDIYQQVTEYRFLLNNHDERKQPKHSA